MSDNALWEKFKRYYFSDAKLGFALDISRVNFSGGYFAEMQEKCAAALALMAALEKGEIANPDEKRMVGHYWLRNPDGAPSSGIKGEISSTLQAIKDFAQAVHSGKFSPENGGKFKHILLVGIGGSALGPQFVTQALCSADDPLDIYFFDNTDADGMPQGAPIARGRARTEENERSSMVAHLDDETPVFGDSARTDGVSSSARTESRLSESPTPQLDAAADVLSRDLSDWTHRAANRSQCRHLMAEHGLLEPVTPE
ncbi:MAG: hypothetical protein DCC75_13350, partial [Proteobacteria bacterium]